MVIYMRTDKDLTWEDFKNGVAYGPDYRGLNQLLKNKLHSKNLLYYLNSVIMNF